MTEPAPAAQDAPVCPAADRGWVLAATILASSMGYIDGAILPIAMPAIGADLGASFPALQWMTNLYLLSLSALIVLGGAMGDRIGRRRVFMGGVALFALASAACAFAATPGQLIAARGVQGMGAAFMIPQSLAILSASYPRDQRGGAIGIWASASALTTVMGPIIGGLLVDSLGWRAAFWVNLPLAALCLAIAAWRMPPLAPAPERAAAGLRSMDWPGAALAAIGLGALAWAMIAAPERGFSAPVLAALTLGALAIAAFPLAERRAAAPIAPPALLQNRAFLAANAVTLLLYGGLAAVLFLLPFDLIGARGYSAFEAGLALLPFGLVIALLSHPAGALVGRLGPRALVMTAGALFAGGSALLAVIPEAWGFALALLPALLILGAAMALSIAPVTTTVMSAAPDALAGAASGLNNAVGRASGLVAVAGVGALSAWGYAAQAQQAQATAATLIDALGDPTAAPALRSALALGYGACALLGLGAALTALSLPGRPRP